MKKAIYAGSFDPFTNGHEDILLQALRVFDEVTILLCSNPTKKPLYTIDLRQSFIRDYVQKSLFADRVFVAALESSLAVVDFAQIIKADYLIRGIRTVTDFEYEIQISTLNKLLNPVITTVFFTPENSKNQFTSSSMVRECMRLNKKESKDLVPSAIYRHLHGAVLC